MFNKKKQDKEVKKLLKQFFDKTGFEVEVESIEKEDNTLSVSLKMEEPQALIGENGKTLACLQTLLGKILRKGHKEPLYLHLDINNYRKRKVEYLKDLARSCADEVALSREEKELAPMPAHERRVIHMALKERSDVNTESRGLEPERRVVVKPI